MFSPKKALLSAALCAALTAPSQASNKPDENTSTNSSTFSTAPAAPAAPWDIGVSNTAKKENKDISLMSLPIWPLQQLCRIFVENDCPEAILALGQTSIHMAGRIRGWGSEYPDLFNDEHTRINNPTIQQAIRVDLRKAINARADELEAQSEAQPKPEPKARLLAPWGELLGENASLPHLILALKMLQPENVKRLGKNLLLQQLEEMADKTKALAVGAHAPEIFTEKMEWFNLEAIIKGALKSSRPLSEYAALGAACKEHFFTDKMIGWHQALIIQSVLKSPHSLPECIARGTAAKALFTERMDGEDQAKIIRGAIESSSRPLSEFAALGAACKEHLFMEGMDEYAKASIIAAALSSSRPLSEYAAVSATCKELLFTEGMNERNQALIIAAVLPLSDAQLAQLVRECAARTDDDAESRKDFIEARGKQLREGQ